MDKNLNEKKNTIKWGAKPFINLGQKNREVTEMPFLSNKEIITPNINSLRKTKGFPSVTNVWSNSIYSFNKNFLKNFPAVDNIVNKIIKSFFTINALANNPKGKKLRLVQRRYKRLSLNKILVSKSEIKHSNDKVFITVYLFNKKKISLLSKLNNIYEDISFNKDISHQGRGQSPLKLTSFSKNKVSQNAKNSMNLVNEKLGLKSKINQNLLGSRHSAKIYHENISLKKKDSFSAIHKTIDSISSNIAPGNKPSKIKFITWKNFFNKFNIMENSLKNNSKLHIIAYKLKRLKKNLSLIIKNKSKNSLLRKRVLLKKYAFTAIDIKNYSKVLQFALKKDSFNILEEVVKENNEYFGKYQEKARKKINQKKKYYIYLSKQGAKPFLGKAPSWNIKKKYQIKYTNHHLNAFQKKSKFDLKNLRNLNNLSNSGFKSQVSYYNKLNKLTKYNIQKFIITFAKARLGSLNRGAVLKNSHQKSNNIELTSRGFDHKNINLLNLVGAEAFKNMEVNLKKLSKYVFKYKLYNSTQLKQVSIRKYLVNKPNYSIYKLKSMNKLFTLYNNINLSDIHNTIVQGEGRNEKYSGMPSIFSKKILLNTYKLLSKSYIKVSLAPQQENKPSKVNNSELAIKNMKGFSALARKGKKNIKSLPLKNKRNNRNLSAFFQRKTQINKFAFKKHLKFMAVTPSINKPYKSIKKTMNSIILLNKLNRIDRFFNKYKNIFIAKAPGSENNISSLKEITVNKPENSKNISSQIISMYKVNYINELLERELLYIYYLKLLSYNNAIFKNWFTYSLKNLISKIYNKKVIFNFINLKYIHLNSDILSQAVNIRLRNFKKNRVVKVLKKVLKVVPISKVNVYACDEHSSIYKYVNNFYNKFRTLKLDIFKELNLINNNLDTSSKNELSIAKPNKNNSYTACKIRRLNLIQANTINFIKYKSVFGVRFEAAGRLTKRSTASRSIFKFRYNGTLRNNPSIILNNSLSSVRLKNDRISNLQYTKIASKTRNGSFGLKGWINNN